VNTFRLKVPEEGACREAGAGNDAELGLSRKRFVGGDDGGGEHKKETSHRQQAGRKTAEDHARGGNCYQHALIKVKVYIKKV